MKLIKRNTSLKPDVQNFIDKIGIKDYSSNAIIENKTTRKKKTEVPKPIKGKKSNAKGGTNQEKKWIQPQNRQILIRPGIIWFEKTSNLECSASQKSSKEEVETFRQEASSYYNNDVTAYKQFLKTRKEKSDFGWAQTVLWSGTLSDKMAAHTMLIQDSPVHTLENVDALCSLVNTKGQRECILAIDTLKDLFTGNLLAKDRKLRSFDLRPFSRLDEVSSGNKDTRKRTLILWYYEDLLKQTYSKFLEALDHVMYDALEKLKLKTIRVMTDLLVENSEQEEYILSKVVNKIGDPINKISGGVIHQLNRLLDFHPNMKRTVVDEVERLLFRLNIQPRTQYYCLCFMNQLILSPEDQALAAHLIKVYFGFFKVCVNKGDVDTKMMSALLSGTSRAFPYAKTRSEELGQQINMLFKVIHMVNLNITIQTLMLIFQALDGGEGPSDRFYLALYKIILDPELANTSRQTMFLNLTFRALKKDPVDRRVKAFIRRLLQVCHYLPSALVCGILFLVSEVARLRPGAISFDRGCKTTVQSEGDGSEDEEEHYVDVPEEDEPTEENHKEQSEKVGSSWFHAKRTKRSSNYDPLYWNPLYSNAEGSAPWELSHLSQHFHPSVSNFLTCILNLQPIEYAGDPLTDFTLIRFLDRFVYRNPKKSEAKGEQTTSMTTRVFGRRKLYVSEGLRSVPVNSHNYVFQEEKKIPGEELFLYRYLKQVEKGKKKKKAEEDESVTSEDFEKLLERMEPGSWDKIDFAKGIQKGTKRKERDADEDDLDDDDLAQDEDFKKAFDEYDDDLKNLEDPGIEMEDEFEEENLEDEMDDWQVKKKKRNKDFDPSTLFASAEEFADMLEENANEGDQGITSQAFQNKDKAATKQLAWETKRDQFIRGANWTSKKRTTGNRHRANKKTGKFKKRK